MKPSKTPTRRSREQRLAVLIRLSKAGERKAKTACG
jgi:hypothetical protein